MKLGFFSPFYIFNSVGSGGMGFYPMHPTPRNFQVFGPKSDRSIRSEPFVVSLFGSGGRMGRFGGQP